jgi:hypothetical protein
MPVILIAGSRNFKGQQAYDVIYDLVSSFPSNTIVVSGMAEGADTYGHHAAKSHNLYVKEFPVDKEEYLALVDMNGGRPYKRAFYVRDMIMGVYTREHKGSAHLFIRNGNLTPGTRIMRDFCVSFEIPYELHDVKLVDTSAVRDWRKLPST